MKKLFLFATVALFLWVGLFYWNNLRGAKTAFVPAAGDIVEQIEKQTINTTGFPLTLPEGFSVAIFAKDLEGPRVLAWDPNETLLVSIPSQGKVVALPEKSTVISGLNRPHGLAFHDGKLYIAETDGVAAYNYDVSKKSATNKKKVVDLPSGGNHVTRTIGFGPDGKLYISVGSSCNVCDEKDWRRAKILVANADGSDLKEYATGLRNSVFFIWKGNEMWATEMGRDLIGDDVPPDEINIVAEGKFYGWPFCYGKNVRDTGSCESAEPSFIDLPAHSAPLGLAFDKQYLYVAYHGSWNRSVPTGYKIVRFDLNNNNQASDFITGWLQGSSALGRPVDLIFDTKGNLYISDDKAGVIYKVTSQK